MSDNVGRDLFIKGCRRSMPIAVGYIPLAISYGVLAMQAGMSFPATVLMSIMVYAGASQFMAVNMVSLGVVGIEIVLATLVLNLRHVIMSMSFVNQYQGLSLKQKLGLSLGVTDETFAVISIPKDPDTKDGRYLTGVILFAYSAWVIGTIIGALFSFIIPAVIGQSMSIALYAMFIAILVPAITKQSRAFIIALLGAGLSWLFSTTLDSGWAIILATVIASFCGIFIGDRSART